MSQMESNDQMPLGPFIGRIVNQDGIGIEGAIITLPNDHPHPPLAVAVSDSCGRFRMHVAKLFWTDAT